MHPINGLDRIRDAVAKGTTLFSTNHIRTLGPHGAVKIPEVRNRCRAVVTADTAGAVRTGHEVIGTGFSGGTIQGDIGGYRRTGRGLPKRPFFVARKTIGENPGVHDRGEVIGGCIAVKITHAD